MKNARLILSGPADAPRNMATDEALFQSLCDRRTPRPVLRLYAWNAPCLTIGYFQKYAGFVQHRLPITRRLTGGLSVRHGADISYAFIVSKDDWDYLYDQEKTYAVTHACIREGLLSLGIPAQFIRQENGRPAAPATSPGVCIETLYPHDLHVEGRKVAGSCQRRRGPFLLQQGSIHPGAGFDIEKVRDALARGWERIAGFVFREDRLDACEAELLSKLLKNRYTLESWNRKF